MATADMDPELLERMKATFRETPLHALLAIEYLDLENLPADVVPPVGPGGGSVPDGACVVRMPVRPEAFGSSGNLHGGAIATLIDVAAATAASRQSAFVPGENSLVTADLHVRYLGRPKGEWVDAIASVIRAGRQLVVVECRVVDPRGNVIAAADFSSMVVPLRQPLLGSSRDAHAPEL
jgi:uncharacterized protein (TIGR00369 family)